MLAFGIICGLVAVANAGKKEVANHHQTGFLIQVINKKKSSAKRHNDGNSPNEI